MSDQYFSKPTRANTRKLCPRGCGCIGILSQDGNSVDCPQCGIVT